MKPSLLLSAIVFAVAASGAFAAEDLTEIDASGGKAKDHWVLFVAKPAAPNAPMGTAAVVVGKGDTFDGAFGMWVKAGKPTASAVPQETITSERESDKEPAATTTKVAVSQAQYDEVKAIVEKWSAIEEHQDMPNDVAVNFAQQVVDALGMKRAYRTGLGAVNPVQYYADLAVLNRKMGKENT